MTYRLVDLAYNPAEPRGKGGKWVGHSVSSSEVKVGDRLDIGGKTRVAKLLLRPNGDTLAQTKTRGARSPSVHTFAKGETHKVYRPNPERIDAPAAMKEPKSYPPIKMSDLSTPDARRSPEVSPAEFQAAAKRGHAKYVALQRGSSNPDALDDGPSWDKIVDHAYAMTREEWGGATIDAHSGEEVRPDADAYALTSRPPGSPKITVSPSASPAEFRAAMVKARNTFLDVLGQEGAHLGVFHDADTKTIDIDPVLVTGSLDDVHDIGAYTHAVGGAYHFKSGDGFWPPHVKG